MISSKISKPIVSSPYTITQNRGLGNRLFKISAIISLALKNNDIAVFPDLADDEHSKTIFRNLYLDSSVRSKISGTHKHQGPGYYEIPYRENYQYVGDFQSYKYFRDQEDKFLHIFNPPKDIVDYLNKKYSDILNTPTVSIHIRRGDYVQNQDSYVQMSGSFVREARDIFDSNVTFVYFSDDIEWCRKNLKFSENDFFVSGETDVIDLYLMSMMDHNIICNSTFSWWGAYLNKNNKKIVVAPSMWYGEKMADWQRMIPELIPPEWVVIENSIEGTKLGQTNYVE